MFRRDFNLLALVALVLPRAASAATSHTVDMFSANPANPTEANVFSPALLRIASGDSVTFVPTDPSHNTASKRGMIPEGADPWNSPVNQAFTVTLTVPGVYGYFCSPHYEMGMVGLIVVDDPNPNLEEAKKIRHAGRAKAAFAKLFEEMAAT